MMLCSATLTVVVVHLFFGPIADIRFQDLSHFIAAVGAMALVQYVSNTGISAIGLACKTGEPIWRTWHAHYLGTSITYIAIAAVAAVSANSFEKAGFAIMMIATPPTFIFSVTY